MKAVVITGAGGALGRAVVARANALGGLEIISLARKVVDGVPGRQIALDLRNAEEFTAALEAIRPDLVLHLAATFTGSLEEAFRANVEPARRMLDLVERIGLRTRVVLAGTAAEYGVVRPEENPIGEDHALYPVSVYGVSKAWQTQLVGLYAARGVDVVCARIFNLFGPGVSDRLFAGRLQNQIDEVLAGRRAAIEFGSLAAIRDYVGVDEAARQILHIASHGTAGQIYHVGSGVPISMQEFLRRQLELHGLDPSIVRVSGDFSNHQGYDVPMIYANMNKTRALGIREAKSGQA